MTEVPWPSRPPASVRRRLAAYLIDSFLVGLVAFGAAALVATLVPALSVTTQADGTARLAVDPLRLTIQAVAATCVSGVYFAWSWSSSRRATPAQRLLRMTVIDADAGGPLAARRSVIRWLAMGAPFGVAAAIVIESPGLWLLVAMLAVAWWIALLLSTLRDGRHRGIHDRIAGTLVLH